MCGLLCGVVHVKCSALGLRLSCLCVLVCFLWLVVFVLLVCEFSCGVYAWLLLCV